MIKDEDTREDEHDENKNDDVEETDVDDSTKTEDDTDESKDEDDKESDEDDSKVDWKKKALGYKAILDRNKGKKQPEKKEPSKSGELGYGEKAYLEVKGIKGAKEIDFVKGEMKKSGEDLESLLDNDYFKTKLEKFRNIAKTQEATISGKRSGGAETGSVEYWLTKPIEEVPEDMRIKVVNARLAKNKNKGVFYNSK